MSELSRRCTNRWRGILSTLGIDERALSGRHCPCPLCGGRDRFRFDDKNGRGTWICSKCGSGDGFDLVMKSRGLSFGLAAKAVEGIVGSVRPEKPRREVPPSERMDQIRSLWGTAVPIEPGDPVDLYLASRGLTFKGRGPIRTAPSAFCANSEPRFRPAMVAAVCDAAGRLVNVHRTYLTENGRKAPIDPVRRVMAGELPEGLSVRLMDATDTLGIAEGIETALSASKLFGVPCWSALNAGRLLTWRPPAAISNVIIFGDNDESFTGQEAAYGLAKALRNAGITVEVKIPADINTDWNDVLVASLRSSERV